jgi:hypothetical protein
MYHEVTQPYGLLWNLRPALRPGAKVAVIDARKETASHGTPPDGVLRSPGEYRSCRVRARGRPGLAGCDPPVFG